MIKLAHIVNPVLLPPDHPLSAAQPVTFETMRVARRFAAEQVAVELHTAQFAEDGPVVPNDFQRTPDLTRSVLEGRTFLHPRRLPLLADILHRLYEGTDASYLIYTNVDIGLQPFFYVAIHRFIEAGYDAFAINRRTIEDTFRGAEDLPLMYASQGRPHPGWDCFVFRRDAFPRYDLGDVCVGAPRSGLVLLANLIAQADRFQVFRHAHLTFHCGDDRPWYGPSGAAYAAHNTREALAALRRIEQHTGPFDPRTPPARFLRRKRWLGPVYEAWVHLAHRRRANPRSLFGRFPPA